MTALLAVVRRCLAARAARRRDRALVALAGRTGWTPVATVSRESGLPERHAVVALAALEAGGLAESRLERAWTAPRTPRRIWWATAAGRIAAKSMTGLNFSARTGVHALTNPRPR